MLEYLTNYGHELVTLVYEMAPWLLLGFAVAGVLHAFLSEDKIGRFLGDSSTKHVFRAAMIGIPLPLCSCGVIPTGIALHRGGASRGSLIAFLTSTPQTGVDSIMVTYSLLGLPFAILRPIVALVTGVFGGIVSNLFDRGPTAPSDLTKKDEAPHACCSCHVADKAGSTLAMKETVQTARSSWFQKTCAAARYAFVDFFGDIARPLLLGLLVAALIAVLVPDDFFKSYLQSDLIGMLVILLVSVPLYTCATGSVPVAAVLVAKGLSPGAALVLLMAGPATSAATIMILGSVIGRKAMFIYVGTIVFGALFFGLVTNYLLPREWFIPMLGHEHAHGGLLPGWLQTGSAVFFVLALCSALFRKLTRITKLT